MLNVKILRATERCPAQCSPLIRSVPKSHSATLTTWDIYDGAINDSELFPKIISIMI